jgi:hypothetical protein
MRLSLLISAAFSAFAFANPSIVEEKRAPAAEPIALPAAAAIDPTLHAFIERSLEERQSLLDVSRTLAQIGPTIQALGELLTAETLRDIKSLVSHAADLLDDEGTAAAKGVLIQANRLLTPENTSTLVQLFNDIGPILAQLSPVSLPILARPVATLTNLHFRSSLVLAKCSRVWPTSSDYSPSASLSWTG